MQSMASAVELVNSATSEKLVEMDWTKNIHICELVAHDQRLAKEVVKALKKRLASKHASTQLYSVLLLELLMNNIGDNIHRQVVESGILQILVKIVKKKTDLPVRDRIFLLLDATQTFLGGSSGKFPQYYSAYYDLVSAGVKFPAASVAVTAAPVPQPNQNPKPTQNEKSTEPSSNNVKEVPESSIIQKASNAMELLKQVLDAVDTQNSEGGARDEFTLDLVEQCSFQKQRVMHLVMASRDENVVSQAIELNEQLQKVLARHDALLSPTSFPNDRYNHVEVEEEEEPEQLFHRLRKGKACAKPEDEERPSHLGSPIPIPIPGEMLNRPLIRPLETNGHATILAGGGVIPPPPAKHVEREKYFKENRADSSPALSLHSRNASTSRSETMDSD